jgi:hypothetical protein
MADGSPPCSADRVGWKVDQLATGQREVPIVRDCATLSKQYEVRRDYSFQ